MKLYYSPGACSLSVHITLREAGLPFDLVLASTKTHKLQDGTDYYVINPKGYVPLLELDNGERLTEVAAIQQYVADQVPEKNLAPAWGTMARYRLQEWLTFTGTELHKAYSPLFSPGSSDEIKNAAKSRINGRLAYVNDQLAGKSYLLGEAFSVADTYLYVVANWSRHVGVDLTPFPHLTAFIARMSARPAVQAALKAEGLLK
ncbi:glutathione transferase GstA [Rhizobacter sp. J219]|uniref:glutathione transferase GstA n=1 Tax=Rhizobacter sp. J219 TaxID=2898430 RepID=UPI00215139FB|nr:glutathione transferase GstA [Rhizobacter sp. J219]MCR5884534.1 glutathione transferase GstA [Rhizobacter sp. J219]